MISVCAAAGALLLTAVPSHVAAQSYAYPIPWPQAGGGTIVVVPVADSTVTVYHSVAEPQGAGWDLPFVTTPESTLTAPAGIPIVLRAPATATPPANQDDFFVFLSTEKLIVSVADDERYNPGSPDRVFFMPAESGSFRGRTFYGHCSAGWFANRIRIYNLSDVASSAEIFGWSGSAWVSVGTTPVAADDMAVFDPPDTYPDTAYKVVTTQDALVVEGYLADNATAPAVDQDSGLTVGTNLWGYGHSYDLRAIEDLSYVVDSRAESGGTWTRVTEGTLTAGEHVAGLVPGAPSTYSQLVNEVTVGFQVRITLTGGVGWSIIGTPSTAWNGYFVPAQAHDACVFGSTFETFGAARTIVVLPNSGTTARIYDHESGTLLDTFTSGGPWEFHHFYDVRAQRIELSNGPGAVVPIGVAVDAPCSVPGVSAPNCGILEGGYSVPAVGGFQCGEFATTLGSCEFTAANCSGELPVIDGGIADSGVSDGGALDAAATDAALDAGTRDAGIPHCTSDCGEGGTDCSCSVPGALRDRTHLWLVLVAALGVVVLRRRTRN